MLNCLSHQSLQILFDRNVTAVGDALRTQRRRNFTRGTFVTVRDNDQTCSFGRKSPTQGRPDAATGAGHHNNLILHFHVRREPQSLMKSSHNQPITLSQRGPQKLNARRTQISNHHSER
jgi:hypothetical protein